MKTSLFTHYVLDDTLDDDIIDVDNGINDNDDENYNSNDNNAGNHLD